MAGRRSDLKIKKAFLDSSVLFTAVNSPTGGSAKLFTLKDIKLITSKLVLTEVERNIRLKLENYHLDRFFLLVGKLEILKQEPEIELIKKAQKYIVKKDAAILAEAKKAKCEFFITLDKKHFLKPKIVNFLKPKKTFTPKMFFNYLDKRKPNFHN